MLLHLEKNTIETNDLFYDHTGVTNILPSVVYPILTLLVSTGAGKKLALSLDDIGPDTIPSSKLPKANTGSILSSSLGIRDSYTGANPLGAVYLKRPCLPPRMNRQLEEFEKNQNELKLYNFDIF